MLVTDAWQVEAPRPAHGAETQISLDDNRRAQSRLVEDTVDDRRVQVPRYFGKTKRWTE